MGSPTLFQWRIWCYQVGKTQHPRWCFDLHCGSSILGRPLQPKKLEFSTSYLFFFFFHLPLIDLRVTPIYFQSSLFNFIFLDLAPILYIPFFLIIHAIFFNNSWNWIFLSIWTSFDFFYMQIWSLFFLLWFIFIFNHFLNRIIFLIASLKSFILC